MTVDIDLAIRRRREPHQIVQQLVHPEVERRRREQHRRRFAGKKRLLVVVATVGGEQFALLGRVDPVVTGGLLGAIWWNVLLGCRGGTARSAGEPDEIAGAPV